MNIKEFLVVEKMIYKNIDPSENNDFWNASDTGHFENIVSHLNHIEKTYKISLYEDIVWLKQLKSRIINNKIKKY